jgi:polyhydroxyalkanoate synthase
MNLAPTPKDTLLTDGTAQLYRFRAPEGVAPASAPPVLLVPSMINRWYVLDLRPGASVADALVQAGLEVYCLDWGAPEDEDRYLTWEDVQARLGRMVRRVLRETGAPKLSMLGYCMGATVAGIYAALQPHQFASFINLLGPFDFAQAGFLGHQTNPRWFDVDAIADAGNVAPHQMQTGFTLLRPTASLAKAVTLLDRGFDPAFREGFDALDAWANDNVAFPAAAYRTYITELYQHNALVAGKHRVGGRTVQLSNIDCPVLTIAAERDTICPPNAAVALNAACGSKVQEVLRVPGGHVGAVVGGKAAQALYPAMIKFLKEKAWN